MRRALATALALRKTPLESGDDPQVENFFRAGLAAQVGFIIVALAGVGLVMVSAIPAHLATLIRTIL
jgi:hypothetical protein